MELQSLTDPFHVHHMVREWIRSVGGKILTGEKRRTRRKKAITVSLCPPEILGGLTWARATACGEKLVTNRLSYGTVLVPRLECKELSSTPSYIIMAWYLIELGVGVKLHACNCNRGTSHERPDVMVVWSIHLPGFEPQPQRPAILIEVSMIFLSPSSRMRG